LIRCRGLFAGDNGRLLKRFSVPPAKRAINNVAYYITRVDATALGKAAGQHRVRQNPRERQLLPAYLNRRQHTQ
jgi:hypothetical protein